tara:strand:+ start:100 stop:465 length:366 start_codon:yes stop_codon:yes gene_type:complete
MDYIVKHITNTLIAAGVPATKYIVPQNYDIAAADYKAVTVNSMSDEGDGTKDTIGHEDKSHTIRIDIFTKLASDKDVVYYDVTDAIVTITTYSIRYLEKVDLYHDDDDMYHQVIEYLVKEK